MKTSKKREWYTSTSLKERGWSDSMIKNILGEPDDYMENPHYKYAAAMKLWTVKRVQNAERRKVFKEAAAKYAARKNGAAEAARKAVETKREKCLNYARTVKIEVPVMSEKTLLDEAVEHYNEWQDYKGRYERIIYGDNKTGYFADTEFLNRISVNYLRHECTEYEEQLYELSGKVGIQEAHDILKERINQAIFEVYPDLR